MSTDLNTSHSSNLASYIGFAIVITIWVAGITYYTSTNKDIVQNNIASKERMESIPQTLSSSFGTDWPMVLTLFALVLIIFSVLIYVISRQGVTLVLSDVHYNTYKWIGITLITVLMLIVIAATVLIILNMTSKPTYPPDPYDTGDADQQSKKNREIVQIVVIVAGIIALLLLFAWFIHSHNKRVATHKKLTSNKKSSKK
jgi:NADH:ubiquinone oxidoreductase subunit 6 (subunit J)